MAEAMTFLSYPLVHDIILPFLLVFAIVFAVLQKSEILGKEKKQIDAIVALAVGLLVVSVSYATGIITNLMPFLGVGLVVILTFLLLWGFVFPAGKFEIHENVRWAIGGLAAVAVIIATLYFTGAWGYIGGLFSGEGSTVVTNIVIVVLIVVAILVVVGMGSGKKEEKKE
jgi:hypothetical protein